MNTEKQFAEKIRDILESNAGKIAKQQKLMQLVDHLPHYLTINTESVFPNKPEHQKRLLQVLAENEHLIRPKSISFGSNPEKGVGRFRILFPPELLNTCVTREYGKDPISKTRPSDKK